MTSQGKDRARFGPFEVDLRTHELWKFGTRRKLVGQPFEILAVLLRASGEMVTREDLRQRLWESDTVVDFNHGLNAAVNKLREALGDSAEAPRYIETLPRRGYRFIGKIEWVPTKPAAEPSATVPAPEPAPLLGPAIENPPPELLPSQTPDHNPAIRYLIGAGALLILLSVGMFIHGISGDGFHEAAHALVQRTRPLLSIPDTSRPAFSPDGNSVAFFRGHSERNQAGIYVSAVGSNQLLQLTNSDDDCCPVWSSDGRSIAFTRQNNHEYSLYVVAADGGGQEKLQAEKALAAQASSSTTERIALAAEKQAVTMERKMDTGGVVLHRGEIDWSPDGKSIAFAGASGIYLLSVGNSTVKRITSPPRTDEDWDPSFSPDGQSVMFVRHGQIGQANEIWVVPASGGEGNRLLAERGQIASPPQWSFDGRSVIFSPNRTGHPALWRVSLDAPDSAAQITEAGAPAWDPAVSRRGYRLAYERLLRSLSIWQLDLSNSRDKRPYLIVSSTSDTDQGPGPQFSPDGKRLAYMSDRSGTMEIWVANRDGSNAFQLSAVGAAGTPRWSPDSQALAFDVTTPTGSKIVTMNLHGGAPQTLTQDDFHSVCPSWSRDGKWIYFGSPRSGEWQVWKMPSEGGMAVQVTKLGGQAALETLDGKFVYYAKSPNPEPEIWRIPREGGKEELVPLVRPGTWASWQVVQGGILFVGPSLGHQAVLSYYDFAKDRTTTITILDRTPYWLGATADGRTVAFDQPGREQDQAMLVENFR